ncbi:MULTISPECIES: 4-hydroxyphenylacetate 3-hydroxylase N-terminal domain-containing protein [unclassified Rhizobium]|uniref:4-hydroxyphenylacetate 3-hydroxylase N-terminal domain-containing protein n=1 Tax=unclassified Rhizobium TaxID=2613769 RepID=UPI001A97DA21|nr:MULTISPECIES: 4-hydroxyphenylacetate 3-hydroxylase N-terminal domain-containing protein [unclassified Rhizobium]MBX5162453.1 Pyoverdin chromophore biosynthetic protein pvcC [Rhizobium sp. NZLR4b]MBX5173986.1 Pyoverdin chromophore biosynthetic protein pvcC [Rhizobium sp. NZLR1b]MBX5185516.1 Pyoverdin chromophore biosynthetic protein pvcC [Rhizobium sp. NZLR5]MBX5187307.1 Pyoverdin chromophore biosynthetic protein pvcC [Rhizobium sp. NZLR3b]MBX5198585.1 Pyoverdin chromophore biosynthetic prot
MRAEDHRGDKTRPFTGAEYLASLRDGREVYINGERIADVTSHPSMRNSARSIARMYDALHNEKTKDRLTSPTDTGNGGYTHKYFRVAKSSAELVAQQGAIADWARMSYGWMGRTADYKAALMNTLGANADWYGPFKDNALAWHKRAQEAALFMNHAIVNPPIDRHKQADAVKDVFVHITKETDAGIYVSGAKVVATSSALTHYNFLAQSSATVTEDPSLSVMFIVPMNAPGIKMFCRVSYEQTANTIGQPFDYPLSSRFDENDAILVLDNVFVPWEDVLVLRDAAKILSFHPASGFMHGYCFQGCTRFAVKLDFMAGLLAKALRATGGDAFRGNQAALGEVIALRHMFWSFSNAMAHNPQPWANGAVLPNMEAALSYRTFMSEAYPRVIETVRKVVASGLIYLPSSTKDFGNPEIDRYLAQYVRGSNDMGHIERIKIMKLLWDATGTEFGGRHALYELNYAGAPEEVRLQVLKGAERGGRLKEMEALVDQCMSDYDENGWTSDTWLPPLDAASPVRNAAE